MPCSRSTRGGAIPACIVGGIPACLAAWGCAIPACIAGGILACLAAGLGGAWSGGCLVWGWWPSGLVLLVQSGPLVWWSSG